MTFMNPSAFWGLIGLLIPLAVLLLSKKKQDIVEFGSLAFLEVSESQNAKAIFPTQWLLFFLRVALITVLVLMLAKPTFDKSGQDNKVYIEKAVYDDPTFSDKLLELSDASDIIPFTFDANVSDDIQFFPSAWTFIRTLNTNKDSSVVYSYSYEKNFSGTSVALRPEITWNIWPNKEELESTREYKIGDETVDLTIKSSENGLNWSVQNSESGVESEHDTLGIRMIYSERSKPVAERIKVVLNTLSEIVPVRFKEVAEEDRADWMISVDTTISVNDRSFIEWSSQGVAQKMTRITEDYYQIFGDLSSEQLVGSNLPLELAEIFVSEELELKRIDRRIKEVESRQSDDDMIVMEARTEERRYYWWSFALLIILVERWFAAKSRIV